MTVALVLGLKVVEEGTRTPADYGSYSLSAVCYGEVPQSVAYDVLAAMPEKAEMTCGTVMVMSLLPAVVWRSLTTS